MIIDSSYLFDLMADDSDAFSKGAELVEADDRVGANAGVGPNDGYIAAMADVLGDTVLTANVEDFERLGVAVETY